MEESSFGINANMLVELYDEGGSLKDWRSVHNTVTTSGTYGAADQLLASPSLNKPTHMAVGSGSPAANALGAEVATTGRVALTSKTRSNAVVTVQGDWAAGSATASITEAGVFDAASTGNMWMSSSFTAITKGASDTLRITWTLTFA